MTHASESGHWYAKDGSPVYTVKARDGSDRPATLADARKLGLVPGVSSIIRCAAAPGLERWKQEQVLMAALTLPRSVNEPERTWLGRVMQDSQAQARKAAERGTAIHAAIQGHYEGEPPPEELWPYVQAVSKAVRERYGVQSWVAEKSFACPHGFGGKVDLHSGSVLLDFKTKEFEEPAKKLAWDEQAMQLAAYDCGLLGTRICANVYVSTKVPGLVHIHEWPGSEISNAWGKFHALLCYWKADRQFESGWELQAA